MNALEISAGATSKTGIENCKSSPNFAKASPTCDLELMAFTTVGE